MLKHIASVLGILYFVIGFQSIAYPFFTPHEISLVKETKVIEDPTLTYENLFSTYEFCQNGTWYLKKDSRGRAFVIFEANYLNKAFVQDYILELDKTNINLSNHIDKISKTIPNLEAKLISIFFFRCFPKAYNKYEHIFVHKRRKKRTQFNIISH